MPNQNQSALLYSAARDRFKRDDADRLVKAIDPTWEVVAFRKVNAMDTFLDSSGKSIYTTPLNQDLPLERWIIRKAANPADAFLQSDEGWTHAALAERGYKAVAYRKPIKGEWFINAKPGMPYALRKCARSFHSVHCTILEPLDSPQMAAAKRWAAKNNCVVVKQGAVAGDYILSNWSSPVLDTLRSTQIEIVGGSIEEAFNVAPAPGFKFDKSVRALFTKVPVIKLPSVPAPAPKAPAASPKAPATPKALLVANVNEFASHLKDKLNASLSSLFPGLAESITKQAVDSLLDTAVLGVKERKLTREQCLALGMSKESRAAQCRVQYGYGV